MEIKEILSRCDHTLLKPDATWDQMQQLCDDALLFGCASVCVPPVYAKRCSEYLEKKVKVCTVIGFPHGYSTTAVKVFETENAIRHGADEIDMVAQLSWIKDHRWDRLLEEIQAVNMACSGHILKVIIETCMLTEEEKIKMCEIVGASGADYIKTSTGFAAGGATRADVKLLRAHAAPQLKVKAAGGIRTMKDAEDFIALGADRLGTSRLVALAKEQYPAGF